MIETIYNHRRAIRTHYGQGEWAQSAWLSSAARLAIYRELGVKLACHRDDESQCQHTQVTQESFAALSRSTIDGKGRPWPGRGYRC